MFDLTNSQQSARYGVNPFQRYEVVIGGPSSIGVPDRSQGTLLPEPQGTGFYIERCDWPCLLSLVNPAQQVGQSIVARDGMQVEAIFKGLYLAHPILVPPQNTKMLLSFVTFASPDAVLVNQLATPAERGGLAYASTGSGATQTVFIYVPPGVRALNGLQIATSGSAPTDAVITLNQADVGSTIQPPSNLTQQVAGAVRAYNGTQGGIYRPTTRILGANIIWEFPKIILPASCGEIQIVMSATALGANPAGVSGWFE